MRFSSRIAASMLAIVASFAITFIRPALGVDTIWLNNPVDDNFFNDANWSNTAPNTSNELGIIDSSDSNHVAIIDAGTGTVSLDGVNIGEFSGGGNVVQNGGTLNFDAFSTTKIGGEGSLPSTWVMNNDSVLLYDSPLSGGGNGYGFDGFQGSDFDVGNGFSEAIFELHDNAILRIADDMKISDNGTATSGTVLLDGNSQITAGSGTSIGDNGPGFLTIGGNALYLSGNSAGAGNSAEGYTNEGYLALHDATISVKDNGKLWIRTLQQRGGETNITIENNARFDIFEAYFNASPVLGTTSVGSTNGASVNGNERTSEVSEGTDAKTTITIKDSGTMTVDSNLTDSLWSGLTLSGGNNRGGNSAGGESLVVVQDQGTFIVQHDLNMTLGFDSNATSTLQVRGPDATVAVNGDLRMALDEFDVENPGTAAIHAVLTGSSHSTINVGGSVNIDNGDLIVELEGYTPSGGESYELISAGSVTGSAFRNEDFSLAGLPAELSWDLVISATSVTLNILGSTGINGDFDGNGSVGNSDLTLLLDSWGKAPVAGWVNNVPAGTVGNDSLTILLDNWGNSALSAAGVPEPTALALLTLGCCSLAVRRRR